MHDLTLKILKMSLYISVAVNSKDLDVMDDSQGQGCKRTHIKLISLGQVGFDGSSKIRYLLKDLLYLTHPPPHSTTDTNQEELIEHTTFAFVSTHCPLITLASTCSMLSSSLFTLTSNGLLLIHRSILEGPLYSYTFKPSCLLLVNAVKPCDQLVPVAISVWRCEIHYSVEMKFILK